MLWSLYSSTVSVFIEKVLICLKDSALVFLLLLNISVIVRFCNIVSIFTKKVSVRNYTEVPVTFYYTRYYTVKKS